MVELPATESKPPMFSWRIRLGILMVFIAGIVLLIAFRKETLQWLGEREQSLRESYEQNAVTVWAIAFFIYVAVTAAFIPLATTMSFVYAWIFGFWTTLVLVSFASTAGATLAFLLSRHLIGKTIQKRFSDQLVKFNQAIEREGAFYLFLLRLTPALPYFVVNAVMGLTKLRIRTFWWVSQLGMLPGTCIYVYAGSRFPQGDELADQGMASILKPEIIIAFVLLGVFPLVIRRLVTRLRTKTE